MSAKRTMQTLPDPAVPGAGHLKGLKLLSHDRELPIRVLSFCQIRKKSADPATVARYREMLAESEPPAIIVIEDFRGRRYIADGHHRAGAALAAGRTLIRADVYAGGIDDAKIVGLEANQHGLGLSLAEKKSALDELLDGGGGSLSDSALARLTGLDRHTVEKRRRERDDGDFINAAAKLRPLKTPEEQLGAAARGIARQVERLGAGALAKALELLPPHVRDDVMGLMNAAREGAGT